MGPVLLVFVNVLLLRPTSPAYIRFLSYTSRMRSSHLQEHPESSTLRVVGSFTVLKKAKISLSVVIIGSRTIHAVSLTSLPSGSFLGECNHKLLGDSIAFTERRMTLHGHWDEEISILSLSVYPISTVGPVCLVNRKMCSPPKVTNVWSSGVERRKCDFYLQTLHKILMCCAILSCVKRTSWRLWVLRTSGPLDSRGGPKSETSDRPRGTDLLHSTQTPTGKILWVEIVNLSPAVSRVSECFYADNSN